MGNVSLRVRDLSADEKRFVAVYVDTGDAKVAMQAAGMTDPSGHVIRRLRNDPRILQALQTEVAQRIRIDGAIIAQRVLIAIAQDESASKGARVDAAKTLLDRAGHIAPRAEAPKQNEGRPLAEYSVDELRSLVAQLERSRGDQARDVSPVVSAVESVQIADMLD